METDEESNKSEESSESSEEESKVPEGWEWVLDIQDEAHLPQWGLPVKWPATEEKHSHVVYDPEKQTVFDLTTKKKTSGKNPVGFITSTKGKTPMPGTKEPASVRFTRFMGPQLQDSIVKGATGELLVPCIAHGDYVKVESLESDHVHAKSNILKRQQDLIKKLNEDDGFAEFIMSQPGMEKFFIKTSIDGKEKKYYGILFFYELYFNDIDNIWLICDACNSKKSNDDTLKWFQEQWLYGQEFLDYLAMNQNKKNKGILIKTDNKEGLAQTAIDWFWNRHANYVSIAQRLQQNVVTPLKILNIQADRVIGLENEKRGNRLMASLNAQVLLVESMAKARIGMPKQEDESSHSSSDEGRRMSLVKNSNDEVIPTTPGTYKEATSKVAVQLPAVAKKMIKDEIVKIKEQKNQVKQSKTSISDKKPAQKSEVKKPLQVTKLSTTAKKEEKPVAKKKEKPPIKKVEKPTTKKEEEVQTTTKKVERPRWKERIIIVERRCYMFYYNKTKQVETNRKKSLQEANKNLQEIVNKYIQGNMEEIKKELQGSDIPENEYPEYLAAIKKRLQVEAIKLFKNEVEEIKKIQKQNPANK